MIAKHQTVTGEAGRRVALAAATLLALLALTPVAAAAEKTETAELGSVRAELAYVTHAKRTPTAITLRVFDGDAQIAEKRIPDDKYYAPAGLYTERKSVSVRDLDGDDVGEPVFELYTGGAHCCLLTDIYDGADLLERNWLDPGFAFKDLDGDGRTEFSSGDSRFVYRFGSYAASFAPLQAWRYQDGALVDVTREDGVEPALRRQARTARRSYRRARRDAKQDPVFQELIRSTLAANAADQCSLGDCGPGYALIRRAVDRGELSHTPRFPARVRRLLRKYGYDAG